MQSRRDQVQAYFFVVERLVGGLMHGSPDASETPNRRLSVGVVLGAVLAVLVAGVFGLYGLYRPAATGSWQQPGVIIIEKETGARYLYAGGRLEPVLNYTSARLALNNADAATVSVAQSSLSGAPISAPIGIPGAPDSLPSAASMDTGPWTVCTGLPGTAGTPTVSLLLDAPAGQPATADQGLLVSTSDNTKYLVWQGKRYRLTSDLAVAALGYGQVTPTPVTASWINPIPSGPDIATPQVADRGAPGPTVAGTTSRVGQVYEVRNPVIESDQLYLVRANGLVPLARTVATLLLADPATGAAYPGTRPAPVQVGPDALVGVPVLADTSLSAGYPAQPPQRLAVPAGWQPCSRFGRQRGALTTSSLVYLPTATVDQATVPTEAHVAGTAADRVSVPAGRGVLAADLPAPGATAGVEYLVTQTGVRYPLAGTSVPAVLGYGGVTPVDVPTDLLRLLVAGPVLSTAAALTTQQAPG